MKKHNSSLESRRLRRRICRIEELETREMLSASPWTLMPMDSPSVPSVESLCHPWLIFTTKDTEDTKIHKESNDSLLPHRSLSEAPPTASAGKVKVAVNKAESALSITSVTLKLTIKAVDFNAMNGKGIEYVVKDGTVEKGAITVNADNFKVSGKKYTAQVKIDLGYKTSKKPISVVSKGATNDDTFKAATIKVSTAKFNDIKGLKAVKNTKTDTSNVGVDFVTLRFNAASLKEETDTLTITVKSGKKSDIVTKTIVLEKDTAAVNGWKVTDADGLVVDESGIFNRVSAEKKSFYTLNIGGLNALGTPGTKCKFEFRSSADGIGESVNRKPVKTTAATLKYSAATVNEEKKEDKEGKEDEENTGNTGKEEDIIEPTPARRVIDFEFLADYLGEDNSWNGLGFQDSEWLEFLDYVEGEEGMMSRYCIDGIGFSHKMDYDSLYDYYSWHGFGLSTSTDTEYAGYLNEMTSVAGSGAGGSSGYGIAYWPEWLGTQSLVMTLPDGAMIDSMSITNTVYSHGSMSGGDQFVPKLEEGDYQKLVVVGFDADGREIGQTEVVMGWYDNGPQTIDHWHTLDLSGLASARQLRFSFESNVQDMYGMLYPAYFAFDNIVYTFAGGS